MILMFGELIDPTMLYPILQDESASMTKIGGKNLQLRHCQSCWELMMMQWSPGAWRVFSRDASLTAQSAVEFNVSANLPSTASLVPLYGSLSSSAYPT